MRKAICLLSIAPLRETPDDKSQMVSQVLFGETFDILEQRNGWMHIEMHHDQYQGWLDAKQAQLLEEEHWENIKNARRGCALDLVQLFENTTLNLQFPALLGSTVYNLHQNSFSVAGQQFTFTGEIQDFETNRNKARLLEFAYYFLNAPYLWGGRSAFGIDCSGFTQLIYKLCGYSIPRDAYQQASVGTNINFLDEARAGDLAFFDNAEGKIIHTGVLLPNNQIMHASGKVKIDAVDHQGIYCNEQKKYTHHLRIIRRIE